MPARIVVGISGWRYAPWRGVFYPKGLPQREELAFASRRLPSIELNGSFYSLQKPAYYAAWGGQTPDDFVFSVKGSRYITHILRIREPEKALAKFFGSGLLALGPKLGPILWQFPPNFTFEEAVFDRFLEQLPRDVDEAADLARRHRALQKGGQAPAPAKLRYAVEIRNRTFVDPRFYRLLARHGAALVVADTAGKWPLLEERTADFMYVRLHGDVELYASGYSDAALDGWVRRIRSWSRRGEVYCYFDNDAKVKAPFDAGRLLAKLGYAPKRSRMYPAKTT